MRKTALVFFCGLAVVCLIQNGYAARPFAADDAGTVGREEYELETALCYWEQAAELGVGFKHGLTGFMDLGIAFGYGALPDAEQEAYPLEIGMKYALLPDMLACTAGAVFGSGNYGVNFIVSRPLGPLSLDANLGYEAAAGEPAGLMAYGLCAVFALNVLGIGAEIGGTQNRLDFWTIGVRYALYDNLRVDAGVSGGFDADSDLQATTGVCWSFQPLLDKKEE